MKVMKRLRNIWRVGAICFGMAVLNSHLCGCSAARDRASGDGVYRSEVGETMHIAGSRYVLTMVKNGAIDTLSTGRVTLLDDGFMELNSDGRPEDVFEDFSEEIVVGDCPWKTDDFLAENLWTFRSEFPNMTERMLVTTIDRDVTGDIRDFYRKAVACCWGHLCFSDRAPFLFNVFSDLSLDLAPFSIESSGNGLQYLGVAKVSTRVQQPKGEGMILTMSYPGVTKSRMFKWYFSGEVMRMVNDRILWKDRIYTREK